MKFIRRNLLAVTLIAAASGASLAHGDRQPNQAAGPVLQEQKDWGIAGDAKAVKRTIVVGMNDSMRFTPGRIHVTEGETVRIVLKNRGKMRHEFVIGTKKELEDHAALMLKFPNMEHDEPYMAHVGASKRGAIVWTFNRVGEFDFACLMPGHYQAGMLGKVIVAANAGSKKGLS